MRIFSIIQLRNRFFHVLLVRILILFPIVSLNAHAQIPEDSTVISGLKIRVININRQDETFLDFTPGRDSVAVAKLDNPGITIALGTAAKRYSIAGLAMVEDAGIVPLNLRRAGSLNQMILRKTGPEMPFYAIFLKDDAEGTITFLSEDSTEIQFNSSSSDQDRFSLLIQQTATDLKMKQESSPCFFYNPETGVFSIALSSEERVSVIDFSGRKYPVSTDNSGQIRIIPPLARGVYRLILEKSGKNCPLMIFNTGF